MQEKKCKVFLLSGFLGSGKTTMLMELLSNPPAGEVLVVLMNEFGRVGVDGDIIRRGGLEVLEINRGSIFCACAKGDFLNALYTILRQYKPSILLVEASGVADTRDMKRELGLGKLGGFFELRGNVCVVDSEHFLDWADLFNAVPLQVESATLVVLNKTDLVNPAALDAVKEKVREFNPSAPIFETSFGKVPWGEVLKDESEPAASAALPSADEWESFIEERLADAESHLAPPDAFYSQTILWTGTPEGFASVLSDLPKDVVRAKGYFKDGEGWKLFDVVEGSPATCSPFERPDFSAPTNLAVFIRREDRTYEIPQKFKHAGLTVKAIRN